MSLKIAIISTCAVNSVEYQHFPSEKAQIKTMMAKERPDWQYRFYDIYKAEYPEVAAYDAFVYSGSPTSVNDTDSWVLAMFDYIRRVYEAGKPQVGICFGHQAIAKALGGTVGHSPQGWSIGAVDTQFFDHQLWMQPAHQQLRLFASHNEQVLTLPPGAQLLARTAECPHAAYSIDHRVFATQHHPEMAADFVAHIIDVEAPSLTEAQVSKFRQSLQKPDDSQQFAVWIAQFVESGCQKPVAPITG